jgi:hypothetical protein
MNAPTRLASHLTASKWANQALEIGLLEGKKFDRDLFKRPSYLGPLWNLYTDEDLGTDEGRLRFLQEQSGATIHKTELLAMDLSALGILVVVQLAAVGLILKRQDVL